MARAGLPTARSSSQRLSMLLILSITRHRDADMLHPQPLPLRQRIEVKTARSSRRHAEVVSRAKGPRRPKLEQKAEPLSFRAIGRHRLSNSTASVWLDTEDNNKRSASISLEMAVAQMWLSKAEQNCESETKKQRRRNSRQSKKPPRDENIRAVLRYHLCLCSLEEGAIHPSRD